MAVKLPDGSTVFVASAYQPSKTVTAISNATAPVISATAHGVLAGDFFELTSGWGRLNGRVFKAGTVTTDTITVLGADTSDVNMYPAGSGAGSLRKVTTWTQITQVLDFATSGGDQQFSTFSFLEEDFERQLPTITSAQTLTIGIGDDPNLPGYVALKAANETRTATGLRLNLRDGSVIAYNGIVSLNETPSTTKGSVMQVTATFSLQGRPTRY